MTTIITSYKTYEVKESYDQVKGMIRTVVENFTDGMSYLEFHITPPGRTVGEIPVMIAQQDIKVVEY